MNLRDGKFGFDLNKKQRPQPQNEAKRLGTLTAVSVTLVLAVLGIWYVIGALQPKPDVLPPTAAAGLTTVPFVTKVVTVSPTHTPVPLAETSAPMPTPTPTDAIPFSLAIVHSNDTWGYVQPCG